jgi:hypothetical protein
MVRRVPAIFQAFVLYDRYFHVIAAFTGTHGLVTFMYR